MEENILPVQPTYKLYKDRAIYLGTFLGGPLVAGYLAADNFKQLGQPDKARMTWIIATSATIVILGSIFLIPNIERVPNYLIPLIYTAIAQFLVKKYQGAAIKTHIETGGQTFSTWRAVWIGLVGLLILFAVIFAIALLTDKEITQ
jgi:hypothetical protein